MSSAYYAKGIPDHATSPFPNQANPNTIHTVFQTWHVPREPARTNVAPDRHATRFPDNQRD